MTFAYLLFILMYFRAWRPSPTIYREISPGSAVFAAAWTTGLGYLIADCVLSGSVFARDPATSAAWIALMCRHLRDCNHRLASLVCAGPVGLAVGVGIRLTHRRIFSEESLMILSGAHGYLAQHRRVASSTWPIASVQRDALRVLASLERKGACAGWRVGGCASSCGKCNTANLETYEWLGAPASLGADGHR